MTRKKVETEAPSKGLSYKQAGVDIDAGDELVSAIRPLAASTRRPEVVSDIGGFAGLFAVPKGYEDPVLVSGTDGVGTKLKIAFAMDVHDTVGIDLVAMCANDVAVCGADVLFFLDYLACGRLSVPVARKIVEGVVEGCRQAGCALLGGETAEMPGMYQEGEYDLAGFAVGVVERKKILTGAGVRPGDVALGVASSGIHSNGLSLARRALLGELGLSFDQIVPGLNKSLGQELLTPTCVYVRAMQAAGSTGHVKSFAHITGGGLVENPPRALPEGLGFRIRTDRWSVPSIFKLIASAGVTRTEMYRTFNMGIGLLAVCEAGSASQVARAFEEKGHHAFEIGEVVELSQGQPRVDLI